jgi:DNA gyrase/topoisomerase IV subunit A
VSESEHISISVPNHHLPGWHAEEGRGALGVALQEPRRQGHRGDVGERPQRQAGGLVPGGGQHQIMLVIDKGQLIRCPVEGIRIAGRFTQGVIVFDTAEDEHRGLGRARRRGRERQRRLTSW